MSLPAEEVAFEAVDAGTDAENDGGKDCHPREDSGGIKDAFGLGDHVADSFRGAEVFADDDGDDGEADGDVETGEDPG